MAGKLKTLSGLVVAANILAIASAGAATVEDTMRDFGLLGSWASQCNAPAGPYNNHATFSVLSPDMAQEFIDTGSYQNVYTINSAQRLSPDQIQLAASLRGTVMVLIIIKRGSTIQTISNVGGDGVVRVKDGIVQSSGNSTPVFVPCS